MYMFVPIEFYSYFRVPHGCSCIIEFEFMTLKLIIQEHKLWIILIG